jgi:hypothetical protein
MPAGFRVKRTLTVTVTEAEFIDGADQALFRLSQKCQGTPWVNLPSGLTA